MSIDRRMQLSCGLREAREDGVRERGGAGGPMQGRGGGGWRGAQWADGEVARGEEEGVALERVEGGPARAKAGEERRQGDGGTGRPHRSGMAASNSDQAKCSCVYVVQ